MNKISIQQPNSLEIEKAILTSFIYDDLFYKCELVEDDFYYNKHKIIFTAIKELKKENNKIDIILLSEHLKNNLKAIGGRSYLLNLFCSSDVFVTESSYERYEKKIKNYSFKRKCIKMQNENEKYFYNDEIQEHKILSKLQNNINSLTVNEKDESIKDTIAKVSDLQSEFSKKHEDGKQYIGIPCGFEKIDNVIDGLREGHVWIVGAWSSTGKTMFALNIVSNVLKFNKIPISVISLEMSNTDMIARLIGIRHNISSMRVLKGLNPIVFQKSEEGKNFLMQSKLKLYSTYFELEKIKMLIRKDFYQRNTQVFVIDYLQNILSDSGKSEYETTTKAITDFQALARELKITIIIISQISNESKKGSGAGAGYKGSGAIESVADLAIKLIRNIDSEDQNAIDVPVEIIIHKNRHGFSGSLKDYFLNLKSGRFFQNSELNSLQSINRIFKK